MRTWLESDYRPDYLMLSRNIGKRSARAAIFRMFPDNTIVSYADDDMLFYPGWWNESKRVLIEYPNTGLVSCWPQRIAANWGIDNTLKWAKANACITTGQFITEDEERDYAVSLGLKIDDHIKRIRTLQDYRIDYHDISAFAQAQHCQFMATQRVILPFLKFEPATMGPERDFDLSVDEAGLLRLCTTKRYALHMGNVIHPELRTEIERLGL